MGLLFRITQTSDGGWVGCLDDQVITQEWPDERKAELVEIVVGHAREWTRMLPEAAIRVVAPEGDGVEKIVWRNTPGLI
jgi:hypothetical protein